jgi:2-methylisocitrate lyase-like PEP mutase family enzyme
MSPSDKAAHFRDLHRGPSILVLPNAWDAASARVIEEAGFPAVATTSAGIALSLGYADGQRIHRDEMLAAVRRIAAAVGVPVTADIEAGYGEKPEAVARTIRGVLEAGAVGVNLEDSWEHGGHKVLADMALQKERIRAARETAEAASVPLVINARTDVFFHQFGDEAGRSDEAVRRLNAYLEAGADCVFPILVREPSLIATLVRAVAGPVNILAGPGAPAIPELHRLGAARVSFGSALARAALGLTRRIANSLRTTGTYAGFPEDTLPSPEANRLFDKRRP